MMNIKTGNKGQLAGARPDAADVLHVTHNFGFRPIIEKNNKSISVQARLG